MISASPISPAAWPAWPGPGRCLALAAPSGAVPPDRLAAGLAVLAELVAPGPVRVDPQVRDREGYLAGGDAARAAHLNELFADPGVGAVLAARGGFGLSRLLPRLDLARLAASQKLFLGFSDLTCLLNALAVRGLVAVHGPVVTQLPRLDRQSRDEVAALLAGRPPWPAPLTGRPVRPGRAQGPLMGGNLTMLCHLLGTPFFPALGGAVLLLEDTGEAPYRLDRLLTQLELAGVPESIVGVAVGGLSARGSYPANRVAAVERRLADWGVPVVCGLAVGHGRANRPVPLGAGCELDGAAGRLTVGCDCA
ncbi:MAG: LD-carboxypeptidase [Deltaproteobacteria bacterium]|nr:LD-carboxypeptidase [Deltaproteobacteria bacterium]